MVRGECMGVALWAMLVGHLAVAGSMATVGSINVHWWWQDRSERQLAASGALCLSVALILLIGALGVSFPSAEIWNVVLPVRAVLIGIVTAVFLTTLAELARLPGIRFAVVASIVLPCVFVVFGLTGDLAYDVLDASAWPLYHPLASLLIGGSLLLLALYSVAAIVRLTGVRRGQLAVALLIAASGLAVGISAGPGFLAESMTTLWTVPIGLLLAWWCSGRVLTLQGQINTAVAGRQQAEQLAEHQARHDRLTGLPNEARAREVLQTLIDGVDRDGAVMVSRLQINRLDVVRADDQDNTADEILRAIADYLAAELPADAAVARIGEVTFAVVTPLPPARPISQLEGELERDLTRMRRAAALPTELTVTVGFTVGTAASTPEELFQQSAIAVNAALHSGRRVQVYRADLGDALIRRARTIRLLAAAVDRDEFEVLYQPVVDTTTLARVGVEALVRWRHHGRLHPPAEWVPIAEQQGLMPAIDLVVLRMAASARAALSCSFAVNVCARQLADPGFASSILTAIGACPPGLITLEITESSMMSEIDQARGALEALRKRGMRVALDDFGTEYSSLSRLATLPFDILKIDRSFVSRVLTTDGRAVVAAIHSMAQALGKVTVAEGVETADQLQAIREIGCDRVQGFLTGRPATLAELRDPAAATGHWTALHPPVLLDDPTAVRRPVPSELTFDSSALSDS